MSTFLPLFISFAITILITPICIFILNKIKLVDDPKRKHPGIIHNKLIPRGGGIPLFLGVLIAALIFLPFGKITIAIFIASFISLINGLLDDKFDISPYFRFAMNIVCALIVVASGVSISYITNPFGGIIYLNHIFLPISILDFNIKILFSDVLSIFWIVWVMNMLNWSKGVDGQMPGIVAISAIVLGILSLRFGTIDQTSIISANLAFMIAGAALGFLIFNFHPAKIFPGYSATSIYLLLSVVAMLSSAKIATGILVMGVPLADGAYTIIRRIASGHSPFWHDKKHFHHLLLSFGYSQRRIALFYWGISATLGCLSLVLSSKGKFFAIIMVGVTVVGVILFLNHLLIKKNIYDKTTL